MNKKQQKNQDEYLQRLLGAKAVIGYHADVYPSGGSTLNSRVMQTIPESSRKAGLEAK